MTFEERFRHGRYKDGWYCRRAGHSEPGATACSRRRQTPPRHLGLPFRGVSRREPSSPDSLANAPLIAVMSVCYACLSVPLKTTQNPDSALI
jgi:hypothetical protein